MIKVSIIGLTETINKYNKLAKDIQDKAVISAVNKTAVQTRNFIIKKIRDTYTIESGELKAKITIRKANGKTNNGFQATIFSSKKGTREGSLDITSYRTRVTRHGISVWIKKGGKAKKYENVFPSWQGGKGTFQRYGEKVTPSKGRYAGKISSRGQMAGWNIQRQNIRRLYGPSVRDLFSYNDILKAAQEFGDKKLIELVNKELKFYINRHLSK